MQHLCLLSILLLAGGLTYTVTKWPGGPHMTFSQHAAQTRGSKIFYALLFLITLPILFIFFASWFVPNKGIYPAFIWFAAISVAFQVVCTWVPEEGGKKTIIHRTLTAISGLAILPLMVLVATTQAISVTLRIVTWTTLVLMIVLLVIALINQKGFRYALLLQIGYYSLFLGIILLLTYL